MKVWDFDINILRHLSLNLLKGISKKFKYEYIMNHGLLLVDDDKRTWRKNYFKYYKTNRSIERLSSYINWNLLYKNLNEIKIEIKENVGFYFISEPETEADDIIALVSSYVSDKFKEKILIVSSDKDFIQIHSQNIYQYCPTKRQYISFDTSPTNFLLQKILYGDKTDGIPNYLSEDDSIINKNKKQKRLMKKRVDVLLNTDYYKVPDLLFEDEKPGFFRNRKIIDFYEIPDHIKNNVLIKFNKIITGDVPAVDKTYKYLKRHSMSYLINSIGDFEI